MAFYNSDVFPQWKNKLFIGALKEKDVIVLSVDGNKVTEDGRIWAIGINVFAMCGWGRTGICMCSPMKRTGNC